MGKQTTSPEQIELQERVARGVTQRRMGASWEQIAGDNGWNSAQAAHKACSKAIKNIPREQVEEYRAITNARIDRILFAILPKANRGDDKAIEKFIALEARRARMCGYDAPQKVAETDTKGKDKPQATATVSFYIPSNGRDGSQGDATNNGS